MNKKFITSLSEEYFSGEKFDSREDCIEYMRSDLKGEVGTKFYVGEEFDITEEMIAKYLPLDAEYYQEEILEGCNIGWDGVWLPYEKFDYDEELRMIIAKHIIKKYGIPCFVVKDVEEYTIEE